MEILYSYILPGLIGAVALAIGIAILYTVIYFVYAGLECFLEILGYERREKLNGCLAALIITGLAFLFVLGALQVGRDILAGFTP